MYCVNCGVKLDDSLKECPLCLTKTEYNYNKNSSPFYPNTPAKEYKNTRWPQMLIITLLFLLPIFIVLICDLTYNGKINWSGYVLGGIILFYTVFLLPLWFNRPNPVIFVPSSFFVATLYLQYINFELKGNWFFGFVFPVMITLAVIFTALSALLKYIKRGRLYIFGGLALSLAVFSLFLELWLNATFFGIGFMGWSLYALTAFALLGVILIFLGICRPAREIMERKFFI